jgi:hypothetical protein
MRSAMISAPQSAAEASIWLLGVMSSAKAHTTESSKAEIRLRLRGRFRLAKGRCMAQ